MLTEWRQEFHLTIHLTDPGEFVSKIIDKCTLAKTITTIQKLKKKLQKRYTIKVKIKSNFG